MPECRSVSKLKYVGCETIFCFFFKSLFEVSFSMLHHRYVC